jgi:hypothetical protein
MELTAWGADGDMVGALQSGLAKHTTYNYYNSLTYKHTTSLACNPGLWQYNLYKQPDIQQPMIMTA